MAGHRKGVKAPIARRAAVKGTAEDRTVDGRKVRKAIKDRRANAVLMGEALEIAETYDIPISRDNGVVEVLQTVLDRTMDIWRHACQMVDRLSEDEWLVEQVDHEGNTLVEPNIWIQYEQTLRGELTDLAIRMGHLGVDERKVRVQEAQTELLGRALQNACQRIGLDGETMRNLGGALRDELTLLEGAGAKPRNTPVTVNGTAVDVT